MAEVIVSTVVETLRDLLIQEAGFLSGVKDEVKDMKEELQRMQCFLKDADKRQYEDESVKNWLKSIKSLAYKIENVMETYAIKVESRKGKGIKKTLRRCACLLDEWMNLHRLGLELRKIRNQITSLTTSLQNYGIKLENIAESSNAANKRLLRQTFAHEVEEHFVGMENDVLELVSLMTERDKDARIISLFGMGGSGKTTLAKQVYNNERVQNHFESFAWVVISQNFNADHLLKEILRQIRKGNDDINTMEYSQLVQELYKAQEKKKCLVVLDDIWKTQHWEILHHAFPKTSKVMLTTRIKEVAEIGILHKLNLFNEDEGWELLKRKALAHASATTEHEQIGKKIVHKCGYLPLAISVMGGILSKKETLQEWKMVNKEIDSYLRFVEGMEDKHQLMNILGLSYEDLPYQLKPCFLYLANYPEDEEIDVVILYWMWMAEGMVLSRDQRGDETLMDVAERYFAELVSRSLVQVQLDESLITYRYARCHLHDRIRDMCLSKCKEEDFLNLIEFQDRKQVSVMNSLGGNVYRLVIYGEVDDNFYNKILQEANEGMRALFLMSTEYPLISHGVLKSLRNFPFLRELAFQSLEFPDPKLLHNIIKCLIHLRFLSFNRCELDEVPSSIAKLPYLQIFHLVSSREEIRIPDVFWMLKSLMHLYLDVDGNIGEKLRLDGMSGLETLTTELDSIEVKDLSKLTNLRAFASSVRDNENLILIISCIDEEKWFKVKEVTLIITLDCEFTSTDGQALLKKLFMCRAFRYLRIWGALINELPKYESASMLASSDLVELQLAHCHIREDPTPMLEKLPKLKLLSLTDNCYTGEEMICSSTGFPNLTYFRLDTLAALRRWRIDEGAMPNLSQLKIVRCFELEMIPDGMKSLKVLRKLETESMPQVFNNRIRIINGEEGADFDKVRHVPLISIVHELRLNWFEN